MASQDLVSTGEKILHGSLLYICVGLAFIWVRCMGMGMPRIDEGKSYIHNDHWKRRIAVALMTCQATNGTQKSTAGVHPNIAAVAKKNNLLLLPAECNKEYNHLEARDVGQILRWIINHYDSMCENSDNRSDACIDRVMFYHGHETAWHIESTSRRLNMLTSRSDPAIWKFLTENDFGDDNRRFTTFDIQCPSARSVCRKCDYFWAEQMYMGLMRFMTANTTIDSIWDNMCQNHVWVTGQNAGFFVSWRAIRQYPKSAYTQLLIRTRLLVSTLIEDQSLVYKAIGEYPVPFEQKHWPYYGPNVLVGEMVEWQWRFMFTGDSSGKDKVPFPEGVEPPVIHRYWPPHHE